LNNDNTFKTFVIKFKHKDKEWTLEEVYDGTSNLTKYCKVSGIEEVFNNPKGSFNDAEKKIVELMKEEI
jgi:hypothetical protein